MQGGYLGIKESDNTLFKYFSPSVILLFLTWQVVRCRGRLDGVCPPEL